MAQSFMVELNIISLMNVQQVHRMATEGAFGAKSFFQIGICVSTKSDGSKLAARSALQVR